MQQTAQQVPSATVDFAHPQRNVGVLGVEPGMTVVDFGAGSGAYVLLIAEALQGYGRVFAVDIQRDLLRRIGNEAARHGYKNVELVWADLEKPAASKLADASVDMVFVSNLLFQLEEKTVMLQEAHRILRQGGRCAIIDWRESFGGIGPQKSEVVTKDAALQLGKDAGFELQREFPAGAHHYGLIFRKASKPRT